jgi:uncharacterized membrane protein YjdF
MSMGKSGPDIHYREPAPAWRDGRRTGLGACGRATTSGGHGRILAEIVAHHTAKILFAGYVALFVWAAIEPYDRVTWWAENIPIMLIVVSLVVLYLLGLVFSPAAYLLMSVLLYLHTIGGHNTFERVPFGFVTNPFGFHRNHYDRVAHFSVGLFAFAIAEALVGSRAVRSRWCCFCFRYSTSRLWVMS